MILNSRGLGYRQDKPDERDYRYGASSVTLPPALFKEPDLSAYVGRIRDQGGTSSCVGQALAAAIEITSMACDGVPLNVSASWLYAIAREAEGKSTIPDDGSFPRLAMAAANARGIVPEKAYPFDEATVTKRPPPATSVSAYDFRGLRFFRIDATGNERLDALDDALRRGCAVLFGGPVSAQYQHNEGDPIDTMGTSIGGHMQALVRCGSSPLVLNSWGTLWGDRGYSHWTRDLVAHYPATDIYAVTQVPR
ncbi:MAG TPA: C1 family peptidase [Steroidobacteraceae bacterium]|nr:C1 family peptidase [Steroidobacteraceae bacterium]